jgi:epoxyqueuosine reductase
MMSSGLADLASLVRDDGVVLGAAPAAPYRQAEEAIRDRRARGLFADMRFTMQQPERSCHPETALRGARTVVSALIEVWQPAPPRPAGAVGRLPRYAWIDPYVRLRTALHRVRDALREDGARAAVFVDHNMHVDRAGGQAAGLTFSAKNTMAIAPGLGSFVALGAVITDAALVAEAPAPVHDGCGSCTLCVDACPTGALDEPGVLDATKCLSYWTQSRSDAPPVVADALEDRVYGCDICQDVCPWNAGPAKRRADAAEPDTEAFVSLADWLSAPDDDLRQRYSRLYLPDRDPRYLRRNALVAVGNGPVEYRELAAPYADCGDPVLERAARRALDDRRQR